MKDLKDYRNKELKYYSIACLIVLFYIENKNNISLNDIFNKNFSLLLGTSLIYIFSFILDSIFSYKDTIIEFFGLKKLPSKTIFSKIENNKLKDIRFTKNEVLTKYKNIYRDIPTDENEKYKYENSEWYKIYSSNRNESVIFYSQRDFLLCRDIFFNTFFILILYIINVFTLKIFSFHLYYIVFLIFMLFFSFFITHNKALKFVTNVIAFDLAKEKQ
ncbi:hypothetical protein R4K89_08390 [Brachyspira intermedia]|uniref:hypothetical protein n=1 Tax=Brachyspira intermedia TaxID=84377 RepID=UPI00300455E0